MWVVNIYGLSHYLLFTDDDIITNDTVYNDKVYHKLMFYCSPYFLISYLNLNRYINMTNYNAIFNL